MLACQLGFCDWNDNLSNLQLLYGRDNSRCDLTRHHGIHLDEIQKIMHSTYITFSIRPDYGTWNDNFRDLFVIAKWMRWSSIQSNGQHCLWSWRCFAFGHILPYLNLLLYMRSRGLRNLKPIHVRYWLKPRRKDSQIQPHKKKLGFHFDPIQFSSLGPYHILFLVHSNMISPH